MGGAKLARRKGQSKLGGEEHIDLAEERGKQPSST